LSDVDVQYVWRFLREHNIDLAARKSWCESNDPAFAAKAADVCLDQEKGLPAPVQKPPYHSSLIPGTSKHMILVPLFDLKFLK